MKHEQSLFAYLLIASALSLGPVANVQAGPASELYLTGFTEGGSTSEVVVVRGDQVVRRWPAASGTQEMAIAVSNTVRTLGVRSGNTGSEYTLYGVYTGVSYPYPGPVDMDNPDGTTDGTYNYAVGYFNGTVYRFDASWANRTELFSLGCCWGAITYDADTGSLWLGGSDGDAAGRIENRALDGALLGSFAVPGWPWQSFALALDPADHSLWVYRPNADYGWTVPPRFEQYSKAGQLLSVQVYPGLMGKSFGGAEFAPKGSPQGALDTDIHGTYGPCGPGAGLRGKLEIVLDAGKPAGQYTAIAVLDCHAFDGPGGANVVPCPAVPGNPYAFCVESPNDGVGNHVLLGVVQRNSTTNPLLSYNCGADSRVKADIVREAGKDLRQVDGILVIDCHGFDGPGGSNVVPCPAGAHPYAYCVENANDGEGNHILLGVVTAAGGASDPYTLYGNCAAGSGYKLKASHVTAVSRPLSRVSGIDVLACTGPTGAGGTQVVPCVAGAPYSYCLQNRNDGAGNDIRLGVIRY